MTQALGPTSKEWCELDDWLGKSKVMITPFLVFNFFRWPFPCAQVCDRESLVLPLLGLYYRVAAAERRA